MTEVRQVPKAKGWVIVAAEWTKRPHAFATPKVRPGAQPQYLPTCPFCPGNEEQTPPATLTYARSNGTWQVRVVPNK